MKYNYSKRTPDEIDQDFLNACKDGNLELVKFLLNSPEDINQWADIHVEDDDGLILACNNGHYNVVEFLLTSSQLKEHSYAKAKSNAAFYLACDHAYFDICKLLVSSQLKEPIDLKDVQDISLSNAMLDLDANVISFLINDMGIEKNKYVQNIISEIAKLPDPMIELVKNMFAKRDLKDTLNSTLSTSDSSVKKKKI